MQHRSSTSRRHSGSFQPALRPVAAAIGQLFRSGVAVCATAGAAFAAPQGGQVVGGQASITQSGAATNVHQASQRAIVNWQSFDVQSHESVNFHQPGRDAAILNRVLGSDPSAILGRITSNGQVYLVNPNGIVFGRGSQVNVGSLLATTTNIADGDFMAGRLRYAEPGRAGAVVRNEGTITIAQGGFAALVAPHVANAGVITARLGKVTLAAGEAFVIDLYGDSLVNLIVDQATMGRLTDASGQPLSASVDHSGQIIAEGGRVHLTVDTLRHLVDNVINVTGLIRATTVAENAGVISLRGDANTALTVAGTLDASGGAAAGGGHIEVTARHVRLAYGSLLDASGDVAGGKVLVGGDWQGNGALPNARRTDVEAGARIDASARGQGNAGTAVVWADGDTRFEGRIDARGGAQGGDGGAVEVSGKERLHFDGDVDASAANGQAGMLLLDPRDLIVDAGSGIDEVPGAANTGDYTVMASAINRQLRSGMNVFLDATQDITVRSNGANATIDGRPVSGVGSAGGGLEFDAGRDIALQGTIVLNNGNFKATARNGSVTQAAGTGVVTGSGNVTIVGQLDVNATNLITTGRVELTSAAGAVRVTEALGRSNARLASLVATGNTGVTIDKGAIVLGTADLVSAGGTVIVGATLDGTGAVLLDGRDGVDARAIVTPAKVTINSQSGNATLREAVAGAAVPLGVNDSTAKAQGLVINAGGAVSLAGAALGGNGLKVRGANAAEDSRAGSIDFNTGGIVSSGAVDVRVTGNLTLGSAGMQGGALITLDSGTLITGAGGIVAAGAITLRSGGAIDIGAGGVKVSGLGQALTLGAGAKLDLRGSLQTQGGRVELSGSEVTLYADKDVDTNNGEFKTIASGSFMQNAESVIDAGTGIIDISGATGVSASNLITRGAVKLNSSDDAVRVTQALGKSDLRVGALTATAKQAVTLDGGAWVEGVTSLTSNEASVTTSNATLNSTGAVELNGRTGVQTAAIASGAGVTSNSAAGGFDAAGAISGLSEGGVALGLAVNAAGTVRLTGANLGTGGLTVQGATANARASNAIFAGDKAVSSAGKIEVKTTNAIEVGAGGMKSTGVTTLDSSSGKVSTAGGKIEALAGVTVNAGDDIDIGSGGIEVKGDASVRDLTLTAGGDVTSTGRLSVQGGTVRVTAGTAAASASGDVTLNDVTTRRDAGVEGGALIITASKGNVLLNKELGGKTPGGQTLTGYDASSSGYQASLRPLVGRVQIDSGRNVELNGLNLDGNTDAAVTDSGAGQAGLHVRARDRIISNKLIAVNKGAIVLTTDGTSDPMRGVYLGNSVYSRGYDTVSAKRGYDITIDAGSGRMFLFDNTAEIAMVPFSSAGPLGPADMTRPIPKIIIANHVANYIDASELLRTETEANTPLITLNGAGISGVGSASSPGSLLPEGPLRLGAEVVAVAADQGEGIALKAQTFRRSGDAPPDVGEVLRTGEDTPTGCTGTTYAGCSIPVTGRIYSNGPGSPTPFTASANLPIDESGIGLVVGYRLTSPGTAGGLLIGGGVPVAPTFTTVVVQTRDVGVSAPPSDPARIDYELRGMLVDTSAASVTQVLLYPALVQSRSRTSIFDVQGDLNSQARLIGPNTNLGPTSNATNAVTGFPAVGGFTDLQNPTVTGPSSNGSNATPSAGGTGSWLAASAISNGFDVPGVVDPGRPPVTVDPDRPPSTGRVPTGGDSAGEAPVEGEAFEVAIGRRPISEADFGRGGPLAGGTTNVFRKRYRIVESSDPNLCADQRAVEGAPAGSEASRRCPPSK